jgi:hypothetical protein
MSQNENDQKEITNGGEYPHRSKEEINSSRQRARLFHRLVTGMYYHKKEEFRFLTVTSSPDSPDIRKSWNNFVKQVRNNFGKFEYVAIFTDEGYGVIHVVFVGTYIPFEWIQERWKKIHGAFHVNIQKIRPYSNKRHRKGMWWTYRAKSHDKVYFPPGLASYVLNQYLADQNAIRSINWSRGWVYPGFVKDWESIKKRYKHEGKIRLVEEWHKFLDSGRTPQYCFESECAVNS